MYIKQLKNGQVRYTQKYVDKKGKTQKVQITLPSKTKVMKARAKELLEEKILLKKEKDNLITNFTPFSVVKEKWLQTMKKSISSTSYKSYISAIKDFSLKFNEWEIKNINQLNIQDYLFSNSWKLKTIKHKKAVLYSLFNFATKMKYISENPINSILLPKSRENLIDIEFEENKGLSRDELRRILNYCKSAKRDIRHTIIMEFLFLTGMRLEEVGGLQVTDLDLNNKKLSIKHVIDTKATLNSSRTLYPPKNRGSRREIHLNPRSIEIIEWFLNHQLDFNFVFTNRNGNPLQQASCFSFIKSVCTKALGENPKRKFNNHMLRHAHITLLAELNVPIKATMARVGHVQESTTLRIYSHVSKKIQDKTAEKLDKIVI